MEIKKLETTNVEIRPFEEWMNPQVIMMFSAFYKKSFTEVFNEHNRFYNHSFQVSKVIRIVALVGEMVIGFTSFAYWPYKKGNVLYNSYQVGNAMIHPAYRGKGIFHKLLQYLDDNHQLLGVDFLVAFPHDLASYPSFMRYGYLNPFDLTWAIKIINPLAWLKKHNSILARFSTRVYEYNDDTSTCNRLDRTKEFDDWFFNTKAEANYGYYNYKEGINKLTFYLKANRRGRWINELIIGDIRMNNRDAEFLEKGFENFFSIAKKSFSVTIISIAYNEQLKDFKEEIISTKFRKIKPVIHFVYRNYIEGIDLSKPANWELYRGDLDTW